MRKASKDGKFNSLSVAGMTAVLSAIIATHFLVSQGIVIRIQPTFAYLRRRNDILTRQSPDKQTRYGDGRPQRQMPTGGWTAAHTTNAHMYPDHYTMAHMYFGP